MTPTQVREGLALLRNYYAKDGKPHPLNDAQWAVYCAGLAPFEPEALTAAAHQWMRDSKWFPALSDLIAILAPKVDVAAAAHLAWTQFERAIGAAGRYNGATFLDGAVGETVRQVFGSWQHACSYDYDSPGWAIKRQTFLSIFPTILSRGNGQPVTLRGEFKTATPHVVGRIPGLPEPKQIASAPGEPLTHQESVEILQRIQGWARPRLASSNEGKR
jgi:hypothetical protein